MALLVDASYWIYRVHFQPELRVTFLDVGKGNAALVQFPHGQKMLLDGGGFPGGNFDVGKMVVAPFLWQQKIGQVDHLALSHPDADHMNGLGFVAEAFSPEDLWWNGDRAETQAFKRFIRKIQEEGIRRYGPEDLRGGRTIQGGRVEVLHPSVDEGLGFWGDAGIQRNNRSLVLKVSWQGKSILFPGDIEREAETVLLSRQISRLQSDVLLVPHHGAGSSCTKRFLEAVDPSVCIISCGESSYSGLPDEEVLERLEALDCRVYQIDQTGAVTVTIHEGEVEISTFSSGSESLSGSV